MFEYTKRENSIKISKSIKGTTEFTYTPNTTDGNNAAIITAVYSDGSYGEKISIFMAPKFSDESDDVIINKILSFIKDKGIEEISECLYMTDLNEVITAHSIQTGYYDDPTGIGIE